MRTKIQMSNLIHGAVNDVALELWRRRRRTTTTAPYDDAGAINGAVNKVVYQYLMHMRPGF